MYALAIQDMQGSKNILMYIVPRVKFTNRNVVFYKIFFKSCLLLCITKPILYFFVGFHLPHYRTGDTTILSALVQSPLSWTVPMLVRSPLDALLEMLLGYNAGWKQVGRAIVCICLCTAYTFLCCRAP